MRKLHCGKAVVDLEKWPERVASWPEWLCCGVGFALLFMVVCLCQEAGCASRAQGFRP